MPKPNKKPTPKLRVGRPRVLEGNIRPVHVNLTQEHFQLAAKLGNGSVSAGIRKALDQATRK